MTDELKPCPLCGSPAKDITYISCDCCGMDLNAGVGCTKCPCKVDHVTSKKKAFKMWNMRDDFGFDEISVDVSTSEHDAHIRAFAKMPPIEIMENGSKKIALFEGELNEKPKIDKLIKWLEAYWPESEKGNIGSPILMRRVIVRWIKENL